MSVTRRLPTSEHLRASSGLPVLFARSRGGLLLAGGGVVAALLCAIVPSDVALNPFDTSRGVLLLQLPALVGGLFWSLIVRSPMPEMESAVPSRILRWLRLVWFLTGLVVLTTPGVIAYLARWPQMWPLALLHLRNSLLAIGLGTLSGMLLPRQAAWIPMAVILGACWLAGTTDSLGSAAPWAIPCYPVDSATAAWVCLIAATAGAVCYTLVGDARR